MPIRGHSLWLWQWECQERNYRLDQVELHKAFMPHDWDECPLCDRPQGVGWTRVGDRSRPTPAQVEAKKTISRAKAKRQRSGKG